jgi:hypothetical protein
MRAMAKVHYAVRLGKLPKVTTQICVDCGDRATAYDHRDYEKPLDVVPVCRSCNVMRGSAGSPFDGVLK